MELWAAHHLQNPKDGPHFGNLLLLEQNIVHSGSWWVWTTSSDKSAPVGGALHHPSGEWMRLGKFQEGTGVEEGEQNP